MEYEIYGWYLYEFAMSAFQYSILNFLPILITNQAEAYSLEKNSCPSCDNKEITQVTFFGINHNYASVTQSAVFISIILEVIFFIFLGPIADYKRFRKNMLIAFHCLACLILYFVFILKEPKYYELNAIILIGSNLFFGIASIFFNSYLPLFIEEHFQSDIEMSSEVRQTNSSNDENTNASNRIQHELLLKKRRFSNKLSANGLISGFVSILIIIGINTIIVFTSSESEFLSTRANILFDTFWLFIFGIISFLLLKQRDGLELDSKIGCLGLKRFCDIFKNRKSMSQLFIFLAAYFIYSDGYGTISSAAIQFAIVELKMKLTEVMLGMTCLPICAILGCKAFEYINNKNMLLEKNIIIICNLIVGLIPIYGFIFLRHKIEFYIMSAIVGFFSGPVYAYTRSIYATIIPVGRESEFFSLFEITDKGTAWLGPLILSVVLNTTGSFRNAFLSIAPFFYVGAAILYFFEPKKN